MKITIHLLSHNQLNYPKGQEQNNIFRNPPPPPTKGQLRTLIMTHWEILEVVLQEEGQRMTRERRSGRRSDVNQEVGKPEGKFNY